jgi:hypothetical protein
MNPLIRWTMGNVSEAGWECLSESTRLLPQIYPEFDYVICYNSMEQKSLSKTKDGLKRLKSFGIDLYEQKEEDLKIPHKFNKAKKVNNHCWKLCPTRLRPDGHELWIDNDIVIMDRIPEVDDWLTKDVPIISTSYGQEQYGRFRPMNNNCCAGFFGLPPNFDFQTKLLESCNGPLDGFDEQGLVVSIVTREEGWIPIHTWNLNQTGWFARFTMECPGYHFIRLNTGTNSAWEHYKILSSPDPKICNSSEWMYNDNHKQKKGTVIQQRFTAP